MFRVVEDNGDSDKTVPYGVSFEICFKFSEPKIDAYGLIATLKM